MIEINGISRTFGNFTAVKNISFTVSSGEIYGFLGMNGAGKTTTIRMMAGILKPTSGKMTLCGFDVVEHSQNAKRITGYIPDRPHMYGKLTAREYLYFIGELYQLSAKEVDYKIDSLLSEFGLVDWQNELIENFSHGMKQRLATSAALIHEPKVLIIDEPMVGLDPHGAKLLKEKLREYAANGMSIFLSTHSLNVAEEISDRLAIIHQGEIIAEGSLEQIQQEAGGSLADLENMFLAITSSRLN